MLNLGHLSNWAELQPGEPIITPANAGKIVIRVNAAKKTVIKYAVVKGDNKPKPNEYTVLAIVDGSETLKFNSNVPLAIIADNTITFMTNVDRKFGNENRGRSFARPMERRQIHPDVEAVIRRMNANQRSFQRDMAEMSIERNRLIAEKNALLKGKKNGLDGSDKSDDDPKVQKQNDDKKSSDQGDGKGIDNNVNGNKP